MYIQLERVYILLTSDLITTEKSYKNQYEF